MATYVLVHGAWHGGWCWRDTVRALRAQGHTVFAPTLTGNGERQHLNQHGITLETHIRDVVGVFEAEELQDVVLVGHSYGGMVISGVADRIADKIARLVYLDAFVPEHGDSLLDAIRKALPPEVSAHYLQTFLDSAAHDNAMLMPPLPGELFGATPATSAWMQRRCNPQALATFTTPVLLGGAAAALPKTYILADGWNPSPFRHFAAQARAAGWDCVTMPGGHGLMMDAPDALAEVLAR
jgi:pimeloyl-ACP methyl ester carboxylesterase